MAINKNFVVKNGLEVGDDLIVADADSHKIGIGLTVPQYNLHVSGGIAATTFYVIGNISAGGTTGTTGSLLRIGNSGVEWTPTPGTRTSQVFTATSNQTVFNFTHTVGLVDVFINGVKLANSEYLDGATTITLLTPAFAGDIVELIGYTIYGVGAGVSGISGLTILEEGVTTGAPTAVTSLNFVGADVTAAGTGAGVTVTVNPSRWSVGSGSSIYKLGYVGIGTTNPSSYLNVRGDSEFIGNITVKNDYNDGVKINPSERKLVSGIVTTNQLYVSGIPYSVLNLPTEISETVPTGSQSITLLDSSVQLTQANDKLSISGIFDRVNIVGVGTTTTSSFNQTFLTTTLSTSVSAGSTVIGLAASTGISIGSSLSISGIFNNVQVKYITTVLTDDGIKPAVLINPADVYGLVINVGTTVGFSSVLNYRSAVFIGAGNTHNGPIPTATPATIERIVTPNGVGIFSGSSSTDMVRITQTGIGNAFLVDDDQNPDSTPFVIDSNGGVGIGTTIPSSSSKLTVVADGASLFNFTNSLIDCTGDRNDYTQLNIRNSNPGDLASGDITVTADTGDDDNYYVDLGVNSSGFSTSTWTINGALDAYLYGSATNLSIGVDSPGKYVNFFAGGTLISHEKVRINQTGVGIGTTNPTSALTVSGNSTFNNYVSVAGTASFRTGVSKGVEFVNESGGGTIRISNDGGNTQGRIGFNGNATSTLYANYTNGDINLVTGNNFSLDLGSYGTYALYATKNGSVSLYHNANKKFETLGTGVTVTGTTFTDQLSVAGVSTVLSSNLRIRNPANTFEYTIVGSAIAAARNLTLPLITANDTVAVLGLTQTFSAAQTFSSSLTHSATTTNFAATSYTTGTVAIGGASQTGSITIGQATVSQTLNLANGVSVAGTSKTINLGTGGASGSFTQINIGPTSAGVGTVSVGAGTSVGIGTVNPLSPLHVIGDARVGINTSQGIILTSPNGTKYRLIVADNGTLSTVLVP